MKRDEKNRHETLRQVYEGAADRSVIWIDDGNGRIVDELEVETRIRRGEAGCQLCHEALDGREAHGAIEFDERGLPRLLLGPGGGICIDCVEWVRWLRHYAGREPVSTPWFGEGDLVLRAGTEETYRILEARFTGLPAAGIWFSAYRCQRIEERRPSGEILPACLGLEFELADFELQPLPPRYAISVPRDQPIDAAAEVIDLVGAQPRLQTVECAPNNGRALSIAQQTRRLLTGKGRGP
jgi:hypothetical protein